MFYRLYQRRSIRLPHYDYSLSGMYFVTICTHKKQNFFGKIVKDKMQLNKLGEIIKNQWLLIPDRFINVTLDEFIIMPNHLHGIVKIVKPIKITKSIKNVGATLAVAQTQNNKPNENNIRNQRATTRVAPTGTNKKNIGAVIGAFKSLCINKCLRHIKQNNENMPLGKLWQRNYYEHIIRNNDDLNKIRQYIINNPKDWITKSQTA